MLCCCLSQLRTEPTNFRHKHHNGEKNNYKKKKSDDLSAFSTHITVKLLLNF